MRFSDQAVHNCLVYVTKYIPRYQFEVFKEPHMKYHTLQSYLQFINKTMNVQPISKKLNDFTEYDKSRFNINNLGLLLMSYKYKDAEFSPLDIEKNCTYNLHAWEESNPGISSDGVFAEPIYDDIINNPYPKKREI